MFLTKKIYLLPSSEVDIYYELRYFIFIPYNNTMPSIVIGVNCVTALTIIFFLLSNASQRKVLPPNNVTRFFFIANNLSN